MNALLLSAALALSTGGRSAGAEAEVPPKQAIVMKLQRAVRSNDRSWLAAHARYPVSYFGRRKFRIPNKASFVDRYASLFSAKLRAAVLAQDPANLLENSQGLMIGEGRYNIWVRDAGDGTLTRYQIITINGGP